MSNSPPPAPHDDAPRKTLWAPWRLEFMRQLTAPGSPPPGTAPPGSAPAPGSASDPGSPTVADPNHASPASAPLDCFFCHAAAADATPAVLADQRVLHRTEHAVVLMNRYPYVNGHLLIAPRVHAPDLADLSAVVRHDVMDLIDVAARALRRAMDCQGYNVGFNVGKCAGAAVPGHVHAHVVPRWHGDTNFMELIGGVKIIPQALDSAYADLQQAFSHERPIPR